MKINFDWKAGIGITVYFYRFFR